MVQLGYTSDDSIAKKQETCVADKLAMLHEVLDPKDPFNASIRRLFAGACYKTYLLPVSLPQLLIREPCHYCTVAIQLLS